MKKWLLREEPEEKHDIRLWQTFRNIDLQTTIKLYEENPGGKAAATRISMIEKTEGEAEEADKSRRTSRSVSIRFCRILSQVLCQHSRVLFQSWI